MSRKLGKTSITNRRLGSMTTVETRAGMIMVTAAMIMVTTVIRETMDTIEC